MRWELSTGALQLRALDVDEGERKREFLDLPHESADGFLF
jgi:hypothetical protein